MSNTPSIAIVGAGLVGRLLAFQLSKLNYDITLYEANSLTDKATAQQMSAAAFTAAGMIAPISETLEADLDCYHLGTTSLKLWPTIVAQLNAHCATNIDYQHRGSLIICHQQDQAELDHFHRRVDLLSQSCDATYQSLNRSQLLEIEPQLSHQFQSGMLLNEEAHIDNRHLMTALLQNILDNDVTLHDGCQASIDNNVVISDGHRQAFDWVFDCRGTGAKDSLKQLRGVRGEVLRIRCPEITLQRPVRLMHPRYQLYLVPKPNNEFVIGATQIESEDRSPVSVQSMLELCSALYSINPAFSEARIIEQNTNLRPALANNNPLVLVNNQHISINGLFRHGYLLAPAITRSVIRWLEGIDDPHHQRLFQFSE